MICEYCEHGDCEFCDGMTEEGFLCDCDCEELDESDYFNDEVGA